MKKVIKFFVPAAMAAMMCGCAYDMGYNVDASAVLGYYAYVSSGKDDKTLNAFIKG